MEETFYTPESITSEQLKVIKNFRSEYYSKIVNGIVMNVLFQIFIRSPHLLTYYKLFRLTSKTIKELVDLSTKHLSIKFKREKTNQKTIIRYPSPINFHDFIACFKCLTLVSIR